MPSPFPRVSRVSVIHSSKGAKVASEASKFISKSTKQFVDFFDVNKVPRIKTAIENAIAWGFKHGYDKALDDHNIENGSVTTHGPIIEE